MDTCQKRGFSKTQYLLGFSVSGIPLAHARAPSALVDAPVRGCVVDGRADDGQRSVGI